MIYIYYTTCVMTRSYPSNKRGPRRNYRCFTCRYYFAIHFNTVNKISKAIQSSFANKKLITQQRGHQTIHGSKPQHPCFLKTALLSLSYTLHTPHFAVYIPHSTLDPIHSLHSVVHTLHCTVHILNSPLLLQQMLRLPRRMAL